MVYLVYVTAGSEEEACKLAREVTEKRLAACVNIYPRIFSYYWWEGEVQEDKEVSLIFKTSAQKVEKLIEAIKELHSYSCPCALAWPVEKGNPDFLAWVRAETENKS